MPLTLAQIEQSIKTDTFSSAADVFTDIPDLEVTITPSANTSKIWVLANVAAGASGSGNPIYFRVLRDGSPIFVGDAAGSRLQVSGAVGHHFDGNPTNWTFNYLDSPATTSPVVYKVQFVDPQAGGAAYVNRTSTDTDNSLFGRSTSSITAVEVPA